MPLSTCYADPDYARRLHHRTLHMNSLRIALLCLLAVVSSAETVVVDPDPALSDLLRAAASDADSFSDKFDVQFWLTDMSARLSRTVIDPRERLDILRHVHYEATRAELAPELVLAVIDVESNFDRYAISVAGARGLMQIMPFWLDEIGRPDDNLVHIGTNL